MIMHNVSMGSEIEESEEVHKKASHAIVRAWMRLPDGVRGILYHLIPMALAVGLMLLLTR